MTMFEALRNLNIFRRLRELEDKLDQRDAHIDALVHAHEAEMLRMGEAVVGVIGAVGRMAEKDIQVALPIGGAIDVTLPEGLTVERRHG